jgi:nucleotide-binding universal stress UspA family protein
MESPTEALAAASRAADLIVAGGGPRLQGSVYREVSVAELAMLAGRPVLIAPPGASGLSANKVVLAWRDTREARRALSDAMPFFEAAEGVLVLEVCGEDEALDAAIRTEDVVDALARRGIAAQAKVAVQDHKAAATRILGEARAFGADLIVLGCYGHSQLGEWMFGGVTHDLMAQDDIYLLLSH